MRYLEYNGKKYDVGTKVKIEGEDIMIVERGGVTGLQLRNHNFSIPIRVCTASLILEIIEPIEVHEVSSKPPSGPPPGTTDIGWVWYIVIMFGGLFFNDRLLIWIFATIYFLLWKNGFINGGKK